MDAKAAKFPFLSEDNRKNRLVKQKGIPGLFADSWSHRAAIDGQALFLYLTVKWIIVIEAIAQRVLVITKLRLCFRKLYISHQTWPWRIIYHSIRLKSSDFFLFSSLVICGTPANAIDAPTMLIHVSSTSFSLVRLGHRSISCNDGIDIALY